MGRNETAIEWTHRPGTVGATWNPIVGCHRVSEGCRHCYAETMAARIANAAASRPEADRTPSQHAYMEAVRWRDGKALARWSGKAIFLPDKLNEPLRRKRPTTYFVNSMSDMFHESLSFEKIAAMFGVMAASPRHTFLILTKRPERALEFFKWVASYPAGSADVCCQREAFKLADGFPLHPIKGTLKAYSWPPPNVELGTSVEDQTTADERIPHLLRCPAARRFVSYEPALGTVGLTPWLYTRLDTGDARYSLKKLDQIIIGGESGPDHRPMEIAWVESAAEQCRAAGVACFVKQDSGPRPGMQGRIPAELWALKQFPAGVTP